MVSRSLVRTVSQHTPYRFARICKMLPLLAGSAGGKLTMGGAVYSSNRQPISTTSSRLKGKERFLGMCSLQRATAGAKTPLAVENVVEEADVEEAMGSAEAPEVEGCAEEDDIEGTSNSRECSETSTRPVGGPPHTVAFNVYAERVHNSCIRIRTVPCSTSDSGSQRCLAENNSGARHSQQ